jgi:lysophospholipase L1-like esterase
MPLRSLVAALTVVLVIPGTAAASVLYVGDSLGVGTSPYLEQELGGIALDVDAETGRPSPVGVDVLRDKISAGDDVVIFDLGTNDDPAAPQVLAADLAAARQIAGDRCMVVATVNRPPLNGVTDAGLNRAITGFARQDLATRLVDWHAQARQDPGLLSDGVHPGPDGYALRAQLFAEAVAACLDTAGGAGGGPGGAGGSGREGEHAQPLPEAEPAQAPRLPRRSGDPVHAVAAELARAVEVGAEFG